jgi:hypothetical protein
MLLKFIQSHQMIGKGSFWEESARVPLFVRLPPSLHGNNNGGNGGSGSRSHARRGRRLFHGAVSLTDLFPTLVAFAAGAGARADSGGGAAAAAAAAAAKVLPKAFDAAAIDGEDLSGVLLRAYGNHGGRDSKSGKNRRSSSSGGGDGDEGGEENNGNENEAEADADAGGVGDFVGSSDRIVFSGMPGTCKIGICTYTRIISTNGHSLN